MIPFTLSKDIIFELPQDYGELTLKQFFAIKNNPNGDLIDFISIISCVPRNTIEQVRDFNFDQKISPYFDWVQEKFNPEDYILKDHLTIGDKIVKSPKDIKTQTFGQKLSLEKEYFRITKEGGNEVDLIPFALALYFQPAYFNNKYDSDQVNELLPLIMECKIEEAYPIGSFFLNSYAKSLVSKETNFLMFLHRKKAELALIDLKSLKSSGQSTLFQRASIRVMKMFSKLIITLYSLRYGMKRNSQLIKGS